MKRLTLILKPTLLCNCSCKYCITPHGLSQDKMTVNTFELLCNKLKESSYDSFLFLWHGGEPLLVGRQFYDKCISIQERILPHKCTHSFQSNITLIDNEWIEWFEQRQIRISSSLDGNKYYHDHNRIQNGKGTFQKVFSTLKILQEAHLLNGVVTVLSKTNINHLSEIFQFFEANRISTRINPILPCDNTEGKEDQFSITAEEYANALIPCFDKWFNSNCRIFVAPFSDIIYNMFAKEQPRLCNFSDSCYKSFMAINPHGDIYNCGRFCDIKEFHVGNIHDNVSIDELVKRKKESIQWTIGEGDECLSCKWLSICNRGCPNQSYMINGKITNKDAYCEGYKILFEHIYNVVKKEIHHGTLFT